MVSPARSAIRFNPTNSGPWTVLLKGLKIYTQGGAAVGVHYLIASAQAEFDLQPGLPPTGMVNISPVITQCFAYWFIVDSCE